MIDNNDKLEMEDPTEVREEIVGEDSQEDLLEESIDYTEQTTSERSSLLRRLLVIVITSIVFLVVSQFDDNYVFNPVLSSTFLMLAGIVFLLSLVLLVDYRKQSYATFFMKTVYDKTKRQNSLMEFLVVLPVLMLLFTLVNMFLVSFSPISGTSMEPNFHDDESVVFAHWDKTYDRFDVIILYVEELSDPYLIKRVIGLPGETVVIQDNEIYVNGTQIDQSFIDQTEVETFCIRSDDLNYCEFEVPVDHYFVLGDNRDGNGAVSGPSGYSIDSRTFGPIHRDVTYGKVIWTIRDIALFSEE